MKDFEVRALIQFDDVLEKVTRRIGDTFNCDEERYNYLKKHNAVELVSKVENNKKTKIEEENGFLKKADAVQDEKKTKRTKKKNE